MNSTLFSNKRFVSHKEGDIWEEENKMWTIKNGIRQNISLLDAERISTTVPITCPKCNCQIKSELDKKTVLIENKCFTCSIDEETYLRSTGKWRELSVGKAKKNAESYLTMIKQQFNEYLKTASDTSFVSENGDLEDWNSSINKESIINKFNEKVKQFETYIESIK